MKKLVILSLAVSLLTGGYAIETLGAAEQGVAIRQLYSAAGLKKTNNALGKSSNESTTEASKGIKYNNFPKKRPKPYNRDRAKMGNLDREIIITAALAANVGANSIYEQHRNKLIELGLTPEQINMLESIAY